jgi:MSHA type pilus biogenesis protein MshL
MSSTGKKIRAIQSVIILGLLLTVPRSMAAGGGQPAAPPTAVPDGGYSGLKVHQVEVPAAPPSKIDTLYSWSLRDADIRDVLLTFAKGSKTNIIVEPGVSGRVTVDLNMVNFNQVLEYLLSPLGLKYSREGKFVRVFKPRLKTRIFNLDYVNTQRIGRGSLSVGSEGNTGEIQSSSSASIENTTSMDFWGTVIDALNTIIFAEKGDIKAGAGGAFSKKDEDGRKLIINPQSGVILVTDTEKKLEEVAEFIQALKASIQRQVMIQAKIVEVVLSDDFKMGINWSYVADFPELTKLTGALGGVATLNQGLIPAAESGVFQLGITDEKISALLDAMAKQGNLNILSSPQIVTLNNQAAMIKVTQETVYFEITTEVDVDTDTTTQTIESRTIDVGIVLDVTPQISADGVITLNIHPSISEIVGEAVSKEGDTRPIIDRRETNAVVKVQDGQTIIMAGLMKEKKKEELKMVPCLGEIPLLGMLFRYTTQNKEKVELVIMLTPIILNESRINRIYKYKTRELQKSRQKFHLGLPPHSEGIQGELREGAQKTVGEP